MIETVVSKLNKIIKTAFPEESDLVELLNNDIDRTPEEKKEIIRVYRNINH